MMHTQLNREHDFVLDDGCSSCLYFWITNFGSGCYKEDGYPDEYLFEYNTVNKTAKTIMTSGFIDWPQDAYDAFEVELNKWRSTPMTANVTIKGSQAKVFVGGQEICSSYDIDFDLDGIGPVDSQVKICQHTQIAHRKFQTFEFYQCTKCKAEVTDIWGKTIIKGA